MTENLSSSAFSKGRPCRTRTCRRNVDFPTSPAPKKNNISEYLRWDRARWVEGGVAAPARSGMGHKRGHTDRATRAELRQAAAFPPSLILENRLLSDPFSDDSTPWLE